MIEVLSREDWGADPNLPKRGHQVPVEQFVGLIVHHTVMVLNDTDHDGYAAGDLDDISAYMQRLQVARPDLGLDVPYSFVVFEGPTESDAVIGIGRGQFRTGAHTAGYNSTAWGVALAGDYTNIAPTAGMLEAIRLIGRWLADPVNALPTLGHRDTVDTACPGALAYPLLDQVQPPFTSLEPPPPPPVSEHVDMILLRVTDDPSYPLPAGVLLELSGNGLAWVQSGNLYDVYTQGGVRTVDVTKARVDDILLTKPGVGPSPSTVGSIVAW